jgi:hypothetical protein
VIFRNEYIENLTKLYDKETSEKLKKEINHFEEVIESAQAKIDIMNQLIFQRENSHLLKNK